MILSSSGVFAVATLACLCLILVSQVESRVAMLCDYTSLGIGTSCTGPVASPNSYPWQYRDVAYIYPRYESSLGTRASRFEYCEEYCNNNDSCLGFLTDPGNPDYTGELTMVRCWITELEPMGVYNDGLNKVESCQKKIVDSCRDAPTPSPTVPPPTPAPTNTIQDCQSCLNAECTWCEARSSDYTSECKCRSTSRCTFGENTKQSSCGNDRTTKIKNFFNLFPVWAWVMIFLSIFFMCPCGLCFFGRLMQLGKASSTGGNDASATTTTTFDNDQYNGNDPISQMSNPVDLNNANPFLNFGFSSIFGSMTAGTSAHQFMSSSNTGGNFASSSGYGDSGFTSSSNNDVGGSGFTSSTNDFGGGCGGFSSSTGGGCDFGSTDF